MERYQRRLRKMADKTWKAVERRIASLLGGRRTPLSGGNSGHGTSADVLGVSEYVEIKHGKRLFPLWREFVESEKQAKKEGKKLLFVCHAKAASDSLVCVRLSEVLSSVDRPVA